MELQNWHSRTSVQTQRNGELGTVSINSLMVHHCGRFVNTMSLIAKGYSETTRESI